MTKPFTEDIYSSQIGHDRIWRIKEISDLKAAIRSSKPSAQSVLLRALVAICYAHWEGHIKFVAIKYLQFVSIRKLKFSNLDRQFVRNNFLAALRGLTNSGSSYPECFKLVDAILDSAEERFSKYRDEIVSTKSNLNSEVLTDICSVCGIDPNVFSTKADFINVLLLKRRNSIAHGEDTFVDIAEIDSIADETIELMRIFSDALENFVYQKKYLAA